MDLRSPKLAKKILLTAFFILAILGLAFGVSFVSPAKIVKGETALFETKGVSEFKAFFGMKDDPSAITFQRGDSAVIIKIPTKDIKWEKVKDKIEGDTGDIAYRYSLIRDEDSLILGIKEEIILKSKPKSFSFEFPMSLQGLRAEKEGDILKFYNKEKKEMFYIPKPFMIDSNGKRSETVFLTFEGGTLKIIPDKEWLIDPQRKYPVIIDPTFKISVLDLHSHPQKGDIWKVRFETKGKGDLRIIPQDRATIDDLDFVALKCGSKETKPEILEGDIIYYPNWHCRETAEIEHYVKKAGKHTLKFEFKGESWEGYIKDRKMDKIPPDKYCPDDIEF